MTASRAKEILLEHQLWRKGLVPYHEAGVEPPYTPQELSQAIEFAIRTMVMVYGEGRNEGKN